MYNENALLRMTNFNEVSSRVNQSLSLLPRVELASAVCARPSSFVDTEKGSKISCLYFHVGLSLIDSMLLCACSRFRRLW